MAWVCLSFRYSGICANSIVLRRNLPLARRVGPLAEASVHARRGARCTSRSPAPFRDTFRSAAGPPPGNRPPNVSSNELAICMRSSESSPKSTTMFVSRVRLAARSRATARTCSSTSRTTRSFGVAAKRTRPGHLPRGAALSLDGRWEVPPPADPKLNHWAEICSSPSINASRQAIALDLAAGGFGNRPESHQHDTVRRQLVFGGHTAADLVDDVGPVLLATPFGFRHNDQSLLIAGCPRQTHRPRPPAAGCPTAPPSVRCPADSDSHRGR